MNSKRLLCFLLGAALLLQTPATAYAEETLTYEQYKGGSGYSNNHAGAGLCNCKEPISPEVDPLQLPKGHSCLVLSITAPPLYRHRLTSLPHKRLRVLQQ